MPERQQCRGTHPPLGDQGRERVEMHLLLRLHVAQQLGLVTAPEHRELTLIDAFGAIFAGMVDPDHPFDRRTWRHIARQRRRHVICQRGRRVICQRGRHVAGQREGSGRVDGIIHGSLLLVLRKNMVMAAPSARAQIRFISAIDTGSHAIR